MSILNGVEIKERVTFLLQLPWHFVLLPTTDGSRELSVAELPDFVYIAPEGMGDEEASADLLSALEAFLASYVEHEDPIPTPGNLILPWSPEGIAQRERMVSAFKQQMGAFTADIILSSAADPVEVPSTGARTPTTVFGSATFAPSLRDLVPA